jgi:hypothetical protein
MYVSGTANDDQIGAPVIIGSAVGGAVLFILVFLVLMVVMAVIIRQRSQSRQDKGPGKCMRLVPSKPYKICNEIVNSCSACHQIDTRKPPIGYMYTHKPTLINNSSSTSNSGLYTNILVLSLESINSSTAGNKASEGRPIFHRTGCAAWGLVAAPCLYKKYQALPQTGGH